MRNARGKGNRRKKPSRLRAKTYSARARTPFLERAGRITFLFRPRGSEGGCAAIPLEDGSSAATLACVLPARAQPYHFSPVRQRKKIRPPRALGRPFLRPPAGRPPGSPRGSLTFFLPRRLPPPALSACA